MSAKSVRLMLVGYQLLCILACISLPSVNPNSLSVREIRITMDVKQRKELFKQLESFSDLNSLQYNLALYGTNGSIFLFEMHGKNFHITAGGNDAFPNENDINFFNEGTTLIPQQQIDKLFNDLKGFLRKIPNATVADVESLTIKVESQHKQKVFDALFARLQNFADQHTLKFTVGIYDPALRTFQTEMVGDDGFHITIEAPRDTPGTITVNFYIDATNPNSVPTSQEMIDVLFKDVNRFINEYPDVKITVTKQP